MFRPQLAYLFAILSFCSLPSTSCASDFQWMEELTDQIIEETNLCDRCDWVTPRIAKVRLGGEDLFVLRYNCTIDEQFARLYDCDGNIQGQCLSNNIDGTSCEGIDVFTLYSVSTPLEVWSCETGFECSFAVDNGFEIKPTISVDDARCPIGQKDLVMSDQFVDFMWEGPTTPLSNTAVVTIDQAGLYAVTVTDGLGCTSTASISIEDIASLDVQIKGQSRFCFGTSTTLETSNFETYRWSNGDTDRTVEISTSGEYRLTVTNEDMCEGTSSFIVEEDEEILLDLFADPTTIDEGDLVNLEFLSSIDDVQIDSIIWSGDGRLSCLNCLQSNFQPLESTDIMLTIISEDGCRISATESIVVTPLELEILTPNIIAPLSTASNTHFTIYGKANIQFVESLEIYDRWGNQVFKNSNFLPNDPLAGWDGTVNGREVGSQIFSFVTEVLFTNGSSKVFSGDVLVVR